MITNNAKFFITYEKMDQIPPTTEAINKLYNQIIKSYPYMSDNSKDIQLSLSKGFETETDGRNYMKFVDHLLTNKESPYTKTFYNLYEKVGFKFKVPIISNNDKSSDEGSVLHTYTQECFSLTTENFYYNRSLLSFSNIPFVNEKEGDQVLLQYETEPIDINIMLHKVTGRVNEETGEFGNMIVPLLVFPRVTFLYNEKTFQMQIEFESIYNRDLMPQKPSFSIFLKNKNDDIKDYQTFLKNQRQHRYDIAMEIFNIEVDSSYIFSDSFNKSKVWVERILDYMGLSVESYLNEKGEYQIKILNEEDNIFYLIFNEKWSSY